MPHRSQFIFMLSSKRYDYYHRMKNAILKTKLLLQRLQEQDECKTTYFLSCIMTTWSYIWKRNHLGFCFCFRFPVVLSIENHCSIQQQKKIAQYLKEIFSDKLDLSSVIAGDSKQLPSPQSLKGKILVKVICCQYYVQNAIKVSILYLPSQLLSTQALRNCLPVVQESDLIQLGGF